MPKFRPQRMRRLPSQRKTLDEVEEEHPERKASTEPEDHEAMSKKRSSAPVSRTPSEKETKRSSAPVSQTPSEKEKTREESIVLLPNEQPSASAEPEDGAMHPRSSSQRSRGKLHRQDESIV